MISQTIFTQRSGTQASTKLPLVALMDIFTILVFFLLMNSGESEKIENAKFVELPDAVSSKSPYADVLVIVGQEFIFIDNKPIVSVLDIDIKTQELIQPLQFALREYAEQVGELKGFEKENGLALTVMAHKAASYELIRSVMATCQHENFRNISLAVNQSSASLLVTASDVGTADTVEIER